MYSSAHGAYLRVCPSVGVERVESRRDLIMDEGQANENKGKKKNPCQIIRILHLTSLKLVLWVGVFMGQAGPSTARIGLGLDLKF